MSNAEAMIQAEVSDLEGLNNILNQHPGVIADRDRKAAEAARLAEELLEQQKKAKKNESVIVEDPGLPNFIHTAINIRESVNDLNVLIDEVMRNDFSLMNKRGREIIRLDRDSLDLYVIGAGGTGGWFIPKLIKILNTAISKSMINSANVIVIDGDEVEEKNLLRQNFIRQDIGKNKAEVMANRYSMVADTKVSISYVDKYLKESSHKVEERAASKYINISEIFGTGNSIASQNKLVFSLIDNAITRKAIHKACAMNSISVIDVGNDKYNGQLNFSDYTTMYNNNLSFIPGNVFYSEPELVLANDDVSVFNCANTDATEDQLFAANDMAATVLGAFINNLIDNNGRIKYQKVNFITSENMQSNSECPAIPVELRFRTGNNARSLSTFKKLNSYNDFFHWMPRARNFNANDHENLYTAIKRSKAYTDRFEECINNIYSDEIMGFLNNGSKYLNILLDRANIWIQENLNEEGK